MNLSSWPHFDKKEIDAVSKILSSGKVNYWTGNECKNFEKEFSDYFQVKKSIALANGTVALSCAYESLLLGKNSEIITTPRTFIATSSSAVLLGLKPVFADVDRDSGCITAETIEPLINKNTKAISVVHLGGWPADMKRISSLAKAYNLAVIEDCSQAHGALIDNKSVGTFGDVATWSFCQDKILTTGGEGGMVSTSNFDLWERIWSIKDHGKSLKVINQVSDKKSFKFVHENFGNNFRMTEMQASIGRIQLRKLNDWKKTRTKNANKIIENLSNMSLVRIPLVPKNLEHAWYKFYAYIIPSSLKDGWTRDRIICEITEAGYPAFSGGCSEIYLEKSFIKAGLSPNKRLRVAQELGDTSIMFLVHPTISEKEMETYVDTIKSVFKRATKKI